MGFSRLIHHSRTLCKSMQTHRLVFTLQECLVWGDEGGGASSLPQPYTEDQFGGRHFCLFIFLYLFTYLFIKSGRISHTYSRIISNVRLHLHQRSRDVNTKMSVCSSGLFFTNGPNLGDVLYILY